MESEKRHQEFENMDQNDLSSSNEVLDNIQVYDSTVEIIGFVDGIESPRSVGSTHQYRFFKFYLNNGKGRRVQVVVWNEDVDNVVPYILPNCIIHLDGVQARMPKTAQFNNGNTPYELLIRSNNVIDNLGQYEPKIVIHNPIPIQLSEVFNSTERIVLEGFVKTNFTLIHNNKLNKKIGCGSVTDGTYKLEVHILNFYEDDYYAMEITKGDKIKIIGTMCATAVPPYLATNNLKDIQKIDGHMSIAALLRATRTPRKRKIEDEETKN